jgi:phage terminase small subunit
MPEEQKPLTARQQRFVDEYMVDGNARRAAAAAGYSPASAKGLGYQQLQVPAVKAEIEARQRQRAERIGISAEEIIDELALIAFARMGDYVRPGPNGEPILDPMALGGGRSAALAEMDAGIDAGEGAPSIKRVKVRLADKRAALVSLARLLGFYKGETRPASPADAITSIEYTFVGPEGDGR